MGKKIKMIVLILVATMGVFGSVSAYASTKLYTAYASEKSIYAKGRVIYDNAPWYEVADFCGYGIAVGGKDSSNISPSNPATIHIYRANDHSKKITNDKAFYSHSSSGSKAVPRSVTGAYFEVIVDGKKTPYTVN